MSRYSDQNKNSKKTVVISVSVAAVILLLLALVFSAFAIKASTDNIYSGISVASVDVGGMDKSSAIKALTDACSVGDINVKVDCDGTVFDIYGASFNFKLDYEASVDKAASYGKEGMIFGKISNMLKISSEKPNLDPVISCDYNALQLALNEKLGDKIEDVQQYSVEIGENELIVSNGKSGRIVPAQKLIDLISKAVSEDKLSETIKVSVESVEPDEIDIDKFIEEYNREPEDATVVENGDEVTITPEVIGVKTDKKEAARILEENKDSDEVYTIPAVITHPEVTSAQLEAEYTDTLLATYSTNYSSSSANRKTNISLASAKINGLILNPGEVFSFNDVVGPRTAATGYKVAHVYSGSKVVDGIGGGICQVSSTLYNSVVLADLEIVYRTNHSLPVSYVPLGRDATVSYGTIDFKFKNNKTSPIKFEVIADGVNLTVNVYGRKKYIKDISIETAILGSIPFSTSTIEDDTMFTDETVVEEAGANGTKVEAYKIVKENGVEVSRTLLAKSTYNPTTQVVRVGTQQRQPAPGDEQSASPDANTAETTPDYSYQAPDNTYTQPQTPEPVAPAPAAPVMPEPVQPDPAAVPDTGVVAPPVNTVPEPQVSAPVAVPVG